MQQTDFIFTKNPPVDQTSILSFEDTSVAFSGKSNKELKGEYRLFKLMNNASLVSFGGKAAHWALNNRLPVTWLIKKTIYEQFCGGETIDETKHVAERLAKFNVDAILDYGVEGKESEIEFERTKNELIKTIRYASTQKNIPFISCKVTGLAKFSLLQQLNKRIDLDISDNIEKEQLFTRVRAICGEASKANVGLFIDAEESWIQDGIDDLVFIMMREFNHHKAVVFNTVQLYRHDRLEFCKLSLNDAIRNNYFLGLKLVRGAYMEKERKRAKEMNYQSPIQPDKNATDRDYDLAIDLCLQNYHRVAFCAATHNEKSCMHLAQQIDKKDITRRHHHISFSQLYGMSDHITYNLAKAGYNVSKYLPYGPVKDVIPYLIRRAQENTSVSGQMGRELNLISKEIKRRRI